jgi:hypothetical protein
MTSTAAQLPQIYRYTKAVNVSTNPDPEKNNQARQEASACIALLSTLASSYPSQSNFNGLLRPFSENILPKMSGNRAWIDALARALRLSNFHQIHLLTTIGSTGHPNFLSSRTLIGSPKGCPRLSLPNLAGWTLLAQLRGLVRQKSWMVLRAAYPQFACQAGSATRRWLVRRLVLDVEGSAVHEEDEKADQASLDLWLSSCGANGEIKPKEGVDGRWVVVKKS